MTIPGTTPWPALAAALLTAAVLPAGPRAQSPRAVPPQAAGQQTSTQQPIFRGGVDLLRVDVQVVGNNGEPNSTLRAEDFSVAIDGRARRVLSAELVQYSQPASGPRTAAVAIRTPGTVPEDSRLYVIAVDQASLATGGLMEVRTAVRRFIAQLRPEDMVGLYEFPFRFPVMDLTHDHGQVARAFDRIIGLRERNLGVFSLLPSEIVDITAGDTETFARVVARECDENDTSCPTAVRQEAHALAGYYETEAQQRLSGISTLVYALARLPGRKTVLMVSGGMMSSTRTGGRPDVTGIMGRIGEAAAAADANFYVIHWDTSFFEAYSANTRRPVHAPQHAFQSLFDDRLAMSQGLEWFAGKSGGALLRVEGGTGDHAFSRVLRETSAYYLLGVEPEAADRDGKTHFLRVGINQRGSTVRHRTQVLIPIRN
jgi:VWFA-related protein